MSHYKLYPVYKDSGVEWLGNLPAHWDARRLRRVSEIENSGCYGAEELSLDSPIGIRTSTTAHITSDGNFLIDEMSVRYFTVAEADRYAGKVGDIFVVKSSGSNSNIISGKLARIQKSSGKIVFTNFLMRVRADDKIIDPVFLEYFLGCTVTRRRIERMVATTTYPNIDVEEYSLALLPIPPLQEQLQICTALKHETSRLDALISKKTRFIELLREKRQTLITHAVTKGIDPSVKMKDSGVEWLGEVPDGWVVSRIRYVLRVLTDYTSNGSFAALAENVTYMSEGYSRLVRLTDLREGLLNQGVYVDEAAHAYLSNSELFGGEVLLANVGANAGHICLMPFFEGKATLGPNMMLLRFIESFVNVKFAYFALTSEYLQSQLKLRAVSAAQPKLNKEDVRDCVVLVPPLGEQNAIVEYIENRVVRADALIEKTERSIELLKERRTALITAAVTGQIDLREAVDA